MKKSKKRKSTKKLELKERLKSNKAITLIALVVTILFSYDERIKCSNSKGFLLQAI